MKLPITFVIIIATLFSNAQQGNSRFVDPLIGTGGSGHTFPGPVLPWGMVQPGPDTRNDNSWEGCAGYHYDDTLICGFSQTHLSGTGVSDWGDILLSPTTGAPDLRPENYSSFFSHQSESVTAGYYSVLLKKHDITAEITATKRVAIHRYFFPQGVESNILIDLLHRDRLTSGNIQLVDSCTVQGHRSSEGWAKDQQVYFVIRFSKPVKKHALATNRNFKTTIDKLTDRVDGAFFQFDTRDGKPVVVKVGISFTSVEGAMKNLESEAPHWDFNRYRAAATTAWDKELSLIELGAADTLKKQIFYTSLYHTFIHPSLSMDIDGSYRGRDNKIHITSGPVIYSVYSLWDTHRALHPLINILKPSLSADFIASFLEQYKQCGRLPMWELSSNETDCMIGFHSVSVITDALIKGIKIKDVALAYNAMKAAASHTAYGLSTFNKNAYLQSDDESESVSKTLEYAYDNWCVYQASLILKKHIDSARYKRLAGGYKNVFDVQTGFMRPRKNGSWLTPFLPSEVNNHYTEGNAWQYSFYAPHDVPGLISLYGGKEKFEKKLDALFSTADSLKGREQPDITGLIGMYAHGNEPSHHVAYLYNFVDRADKSYKTVKNVCEKFYRNGPDGLSGNDDCGQMSAWYIFSSLGMYPVCPGSNEYQLTAPLFPEITVRLPNGKTLRIIKADKRAAASFNGKSLLSNTVTHDIFLKGGKLILPEPDTLNNRQTISRSSALSERFIPAPIITSSSGRIFEKSTSITFSVPGSNSKQFIFSTDSVPTVWNKYNERIILDKSSFVTCRAIVGKDSSSASSGRFYKIPGSSTVTVHSKLNSQYSAEGGLSLVDGVAGDVDWRKGDWLGVQFGNLAFTVDLGSQTEISYFSLNCLQDTRSWILFPVQVSVYVSDDNKNYRPVGATENAVKAEDYNVQRRKFSIQLNTSEKARYIKVIAENYGKLPEWHAGKGGGAFIFADEFQFR